MRILFSLIFILSVVNARGANDVTSSNAVSQYFLEAKFESFATMKSIPAFVVNSLSNLVEKRELRFADPGQKFNSTDVVEGGNLLWRRLIFAGKSGQKWFVCYEKGGYAFHYCVVLIETSDKVASPIWGGVFFDKVRDHEELRSLFHKGKIIEVDLKKPQGNF